MKCWRTECWSNVKVGCYIKNGNVLQPSCHTCAIVHSDYEVVNARMKKKRVILGLGMFELAQHEGNGVATVLIHKDYI